MKAAFIENLCSKMVLYKTTQKTISLKIYKLRHKEKSLRVLSPPFAFMRIKGHFISELYPNELCRSAGSQRRRAKGFLELSKNLRVPKVGPRLGIGQDPQGVDSLRCWELSLFGRTKLSMNAPRFS